MISIHPQVEVLRRPLDSALSALVGMDDHLVAVDVFASGGDADQLVGDFGGFGWVDLEAARIDG